MTTVIKVVRLDKIPPPSAAQWEEVTMDKAANPELPAQWCQSQPIKLATAGTFLSKETENLIKETWPRGIERIPEKY